MHIGVLALQGDFREHILSLKKLGISAKEIRLPKDLADIDGLIIPGGESTTIGKLMVLYGLDKEIIKKYNQEGMAIYGTCAGAILLAKDIINSNQPRLSLIDISIDRNSYGRQIDSFETDIQIKNFDESFHAIFIRAPIIKKLNPKIEILSECNKDPVLLQHEKILISTFHPEMTNDPRIHKLFVDICAKVNRGI